MLWQEMDRTQREEAVADVLQDEAAWVAGQHRVDRERVRGVYERILRQCGGYPLPDDLGERVWKSGLCVGPTLADALRWLPPDDALALFESEDLTRLAEREVATWYLFDDGPFYTLEELAELTAKLADYLEENRTQLVGIGYPATGFGHKMSVSTGPRVVLASLYPVKIPTLVEERMELAEEAQENPLWDRSGVPGDCQSFIRRRTYRWTRPREPSGGPGTPAPRVRRFGGIPTVRGNGNPPILDRSLSDDVRVGCSYWEAPYLEDLDPSEATCLERLRPVILDLKLRILRRLATALRHRAVDGLWCDILRFLTDALPADAVAFCLRMDRFSTATICARGRRPRTATGISHQAGSPRSWRRSATARRS